MDNIDNCKTCGAKGALEPRGKKWIIACLNRFRGCPMNARTHMCSTPDEAVTAWNTRSPVTDEMVEMAVKALEPFAKAAMGIKAFDPDFPLDGAALRASFDWYDKCQGEALKRNSVRLHDINFAAETHAALTAALGGPHG